LLHIIKSRKTDLAVAISGFMISFLGSLPLGTVNVLTVQLAASNGAKTALLFAAGCLVAELIYVRISLALRDLVIKVGAIQKILHWISVAILIGLAIASFAATRFSSQPVFVSLPGGFSPFLFGFILMAVNPVQVPFWFGWTTVLFERKVLLPDTLHYILYMAGVGLGSVSASVLFILAGHFLITWFPHSQGAFHLVMGCLYMLTAVYLVWKRGRKFKGV
jgi:threonine/homoserine/homoserine lactone efflux protein